MLKDLETSLIDHTEKGKKLYELMSDLNKTVSKLKEVNPIYEAIRKLDTMWLDLYEIEKNNHQIVTLLQRKIEHIKATECDE